MFRALKVLPSWPGLVLAVVLALGVGGYYYLDTHQRCVAQRKQREALMTAVEAVAAESGLRLRLADVFEFPWDAVRILQGFRPEARLLDCPFGWDMTRAERQRLIEDDSYTVLAFTRAGQPAGAVEVRGDRLIFGDDLPDDASLPRDRAVFAVAGGGGAPFRLRLNMDESAVLPE